MTDIPKCTVCGEPMPAGETMFKFHGYSGPCPKPPLLPPHQFRVVAEKEELDKKAYALSEFIGNNPAFETLDPAEQERLKEQNDVMWHTPKYWALALLHLVAHKPADLNY